MTWFVHIIKTHASKGAKELLPEFESQFMHKIDKRFQDINENLVDLQSENKKLRRSVENLQFQLYRKDVKISEMVVKLDCIEQKELTNDVQIVGVEESLTDEVRRIRRKF